MSAVQKLQSGTDLDVKLDDATTNEFSRDWSLFEVQPQAVVFPHSPADVEKLVSFVSEHAEEGNNISLTGRSAGTDMTGGPLNESIIMSCTEHLNEVERIADDHAVVQPGVYYHDFENDISPKHLTMPTYPASKSIAALGGMIMNNCGGEKTLRYGQMRDYVNSVNMVLRDGNEYTFGPVSEEELESKKAQNDLEGEVYRRMHELLEDNWEAVQAAEPDTSKNSAGYALWRIWDREEGTFDLSQLFVGSQGTLGMLTEANIKLQESKDHERLVAVFLDSWDALPSIVNKLLPHDPESLEVFDKETIKLGLRFMPDIAKAVGQSLLKFAWQFLPEVGMGIRMGGMPEMILLVEIAEETEEELDEKTAQIEQVLNDEGVLSRTLYEESEQQKYWTMRRKSFDLLYSSMDDKQTAPFVEDFCIQPDDIPEFLPRARELLEDYGIDVNIAGHAGNGNFHIIPLMDLSKQEEREKIPEVAKRFYDLVLEYDGTITAEHNDGIIRTPFLPQMYGEEVYGLFEEVKDIFDPDNIFNPGKKVEGTMNYMQEHIAKEKEGNDS
jgi:FAD/FMN-containing dehydrogenase